MLNFFAWLVSWLPYAWQPRRILEMSQRSGQWRALRDEHLRQNPECAVCGRSFEVVVHHVIPVSFDPEKELDPKNLLTLCAAPCHLMFGHFFNYHCYNKDVRKMAAEFKKAMDKRKCLKVPG